VLQRAQAIIEHLVGDNPYVVEVGVYRGELSEELRKRTKNLYLVDAWKPSDSYILSGDKIATLSQAQHENNYRKVCQIDATIIRSDSVIAAGTFPDKFFDLVFIDADHSYEGCKADILAWTPKIVGGGWLSGHDYGSFGVTEAVDEIDREIELGLNNTWFCQL